MRNNRVLAVILLTLLPHSIALASDATKKVARASYEAGNRFVKENKLIEAREAYCSAFAQDTSSSKYQKKCHDSSKNASILAESLGRQEMDRDPVRAATLIRDSLRFEIGRASCRERV